MMAGLWVIPLVTIGLVAESTSGITGTSGQRYVIDANWGGGSASFSDDPIAAGVGLSVGTNGIQVVCSDYFIKIIFVFH